MSEYDYRNIPWCPLCQRTMYGGRCPNHGTQTDMWRAVEEAEAERSAYIAKIQSAKRTVAMRDPYFQVEEWP